MGMNNIEILEHFGFTIDDAEFKKNYMHLLEKEWLGKWVDVMGPPDEYPDAPRYYEILSFALMGMQITRQLE
jgi:hypothetical protein